MPHTQFPPLLTLVWYMGYINEPISMHCDELKKKLTLYSDFTSFSLMSSFYCPNFKIRRLYNKNSQIIGVADDTGPPPARWQSWPWSSVPSQWARCSLSRAPHCCHLPALGPTSNPWSRNGHQSSALTSSALRGKIPVQSSFQAVNQKNMLECRWAQVTWEHVVVSVKDTGGHARLSATGI